MVKEIKEEECNLFGRERCISILIWRLFGNKYGVSCSSIYIEGGSSDRRANLCLWISIKMLKQTDGEGKVQANRPMARKELKTRDARI